MAASLAIPARSIQWRAAAAGALVLSALAAYVGAVAGPRQILPLGLGAALGLTLYHAAFGFTGPWRTFMLERRGSGLRAHLLLLGATSLLFAPVLARGSLFGQPVTPAQAPVGVALVAGAFLFGIGMQLGAGCASGTLFSAGGGNTRMLVTLAGFVAGSVVGTAHAERWSALPALPPIVLIARVGAGWTLLIDALLLGGLAAASVAWERSRHGSLAPRAPGGPGRAGLLRGPWPMEAGAVALTLLGLATLAATGRPWGVTSAFALWGTKAAIACGVDAASWGYWSSPARAAALRAPVAADATSVMDFGIMAGALIAASLAGRFAPAWRLSLGSAGASLAGGLLLGYGARLASGCNIGALLGGIASSSLHGWVWFAAAFAGNAVVVRLRRKQATASALPAAHVPAGAPAGRRSTNVGGS